MNKFIIGLLSLFIVTGLAAQDKIVIKSGDKVAFLGDSITQAGARPGGYCTLIISALNAKGLKVTSRYAGISGHKSNQMLARLEKDVLKHKPQWMTLSCGVNDVWHGARGVALEPYKKNITEIVDKAQAAGIKVILLTSTMIKEKQSGDLNQKLIPYNDFIKQLSKDKSCLLADLNQIMQETIKTVPKDNRGNTVTTDGVHMNSAGNMMMAKGILKTMGFSDKDISSTEAAWKDMPNTNSLRLNIGMSHNEKMKLDAIAKERKTSVQKLLMEAVEAEKKKLLQK